MSVVSQLELLGMCKKWSLWLLSWAGVCLLLVASGCDAGELALSLQSLTS